MNQCIWCGTKENLHKHDNTRFVCRSCNTERIRQYRKTKLGKEAIRRANKKYAQAHPERKAAWNATYSKNITEEPCMVCGKLPTHKHHPDPKKKLFIIHLCPYHHKQAHKILV